MVLVASSLHGNRHKPGQPDGLDLYGFAQELATPWRHPKFVSQSNAAMAGSVDFPGFVFMNSGRMFRAVIVKASGRLNLPNPTYFMYASTDHGTLAGKSGIFMWTSSSPKGPWTPVGVGPVYTDSDGGLQTEFPSVVWDPDTRQFFLYYIYNISTTALAVSSDGVTWEKVANSVFNGVAAEYTGYPSVTRLGPYDWWAHHLLAGGGAGWYTCSRSRDGVTWVTDPWPKSLAKDAAMDQQRESSNPTQLFLWNGQVWGLGSTKLSDTQGGQPGDQETIAGPVSNDFRQFIQRPQQIWTPSHTWELGVYHSASSLFRDDDGTLWLVYRGGDGVGFGVAKCISGTEGVGG